MKNCILVMAAIMVMACSAAAQQVAGVWQLDEITTTGADGGTKKMSQPSMYLFTKSHYSIIYVSRDQPRLTDEASAMTADQLRDNFVNWFVANAGTYNIKAGKMTLNPTVAKSPGYMSGGRWNAYKVNVTGKTMTLVTDSNNTGPSANPTTYKLTRIE